MEHYIDNLRLKYERDINNLYRVFFHTLLLLINT